MSPPMRRAAAHWPWSGTEDLVALDVPARTLDLLVDRLELEARRSAWRPAAARHARGWPALFDRHVLQAPEGADLDFLRPATPEDLAFIDPVVGRS